MRDRAPKTLQKRNFWLLGIRLEAEDLVLELADGAGLGVAEGLGSLLHGADHGRRTAEEDLDVAGGGREALLIAKLAIWAKFDRYASVTYLDHVRGDEADTTSPALRGVVQDIVNIEALVLLGQLLQLLLEQNIVGVDVGEDQIDLGGVVTTVAGTVANDSLDNLEHGSDTGTTSDHTNVAAHVGSVDHGTLGTTDLHGLANLQLGQVLGDVTLGVGLNQQVKVAGFIVGGDGGVRADDFLGLAGNGGSQGDVLTDWQTQDIGGTGQGKAVDGNVVRDLGLLLEDELLELGRVQDLARLCIGGNTRMISF